MTVTLDMAYPFTGRWLVQNSPGNRVPSHGTPQFASSYAIDFVPVDDSGHSAPLTLGAFVRPEPPEKFPGFGRTLLSPVDGTVVTVHDGERDHPAYPGAAVGWIRADAATTGCRWMGVLGGKSCCDRD
ncbi:hypothetical protein [Corynebacterium glyciniphilum]|uniref:hypothetical protein n=1 Tax=Corynebacterium glyciniphilum TaxID=1404244 RepID=UPI003FD619A9